MGSRNIKQMLQISFYCTVIIFLYFGLSNSGEATNEEPFNELSKIAEVMDKQDIEMTNWTLYTREHLSSWNNSNGSKDELMSLQNKTMDFTWQSETTSKHHGQKKTIATLEHVELGITETITYIIFPHNDRFHSYLIYEVQGKKYSRDEIQTFSPILLSRLKDLFIENTNIFTCTTGNGNDKLNFGLEEQTERILQQFSARKIESIKEETFISVSAYTNTWNNVLITNNEKMNLQVAIRAKERLGGRTTVTIGTPIITTEY